MQASSSSIQLWREDYINEVYILGHILSWLIPDKICLKIQTSFDYVFEEKKKVKNGNHNQWGC